MVRHVDVKVVVEDGAGVAMRVARGDGDLEGGVQEIGLVIAGEGDIERGNGDVLEGEAGLARAQYLSRGEGGADGYGDCDCYGDSDDEDAAAAEPQEVAAFAFRAHEGRFSCAMRRGWCVSWWGVK